MEYGAIKHHSKQYLIEHGLYVKQVSKNQLKKFIETGGNKLRQCRERLLRDEQAETEEGAVYTNNILLKDTDSHLTETHVSSGDSNEEGRTFDGNAQMVASDKSMSGRDSTDELVKYIDKDDLGKGDIPSSCKNIKDNGFVEASTEDLNVDKDTIETLQSSAGKRNCDSELL